MGRIITRCTQDISGVDGGIQANLFYFLYLTIVLSMYFATSVVMAGIFAVIPGFIMLSLGAFLGHVYLKASLCMRREMSNLKGPMISQVTTALDALREYCIFCSSQSHLCRFLSINSCLRRSVFLPRSSEEKGQPLHEGFFGAL